MLITISMCRDAVIALLFVGTCHALQDEIRTEVVCPISFDLGEYYGWIKLQRFRYGFGLHVYRVVGTDLDPPAILLCVFKLYAQLISLSESFDIEKAGNLYRSRQSSRAHASLAVKLSLFFFYRRIFLVNQRCLKLFIRLLQPRLRSSLVHPFELSIFSSNVGQ